MGTYKQTNGCQIQNMSGVRKVKPQDFVRLEGFDDQPSDANQLLTAKRFLATVKRRRSVREFSDQRVSREVIANCIAAAGTAPSGANQQPWHFVAVNEQATKRSIRVEAEQEEAEFYQRRAPREWLDALAPLGTDEHKPFLEVAPWLIAIFAKSYGVDADGETTKHYYVSESVGIATGILITALNSCGLATLTHTPSPMKFLNKILGRPDNERPFLLLVTGYPTTDCRVPNISKKPLQHIATFLE